jgi:RNA polymerase sigma factor (sigma-70 family)
MVPSGAGSVPQEEVEERFTRLYADHARGVMAYVLRRAPREDAADLVAEVFLAAWRRADEVPREPDARLWLYGIARGLLSNQVRGDRRRARLQERLRQERSTGQSSESDHEVETVVDAALGRLGESDREVLMLAGWEGLDPAEIAGVLRITRVAARSRLHRARRRFEKELGELERGEASAHPADREGEEAK